MIIFWNLIFSTVVDGMEVFPEISDPDVAAWRHLLQGGAPQ